MRAAAVGLAPVSGAAAAVAAAAARLSGRRLRLGARQIRPAAIGAEQARVFARTETRFGGQVRAIKMMHDGADEEEPRKNLNINSSRRHGCAPAD